MSEKKRILYVTQELNPFVAISEMSKKLRELPQYIQNQGMEIRVLMPKFGTINERRHRLHEVVRLSGINIIINEDDYPLIIKVASIPGARMQVYFLDNEDFFQRKAVFGNEKEKFFKDNTERMIFFCKGVIETVKKFGWPPDIIHCHGWMTSLIPLYLKTAYKNDPVLNKARVVYSVYESSFDEPLSPDFLEKAPLIKKAIKKEEMKHYMNANNVGLDMGAATYSDAVILTSDQVDISLSDFVDSADKPTLKTNGESFLEEHHKFYQEVLTDN